MNEFKLDNQPKIETGFKVPKDYFDTLSEKITSKISSDNHDVISLYQRNKQLIYAVAAFLVLAINIIFFMPSSVKVSDIDEATFEHYISYNTKITPYELAEYLDNEDIEKLKVDFKISDTVLEESVLNNLDIENYILN